MALLSVSGLYKSFSGVPAVDGVSFSANPGELLCLLGPSGCGKTTMLRMLAGLEDPDAGTIEFGGRIINDLAPQQRGFGLMFQDLALFPHINVFGNVAFGLRMQKLPSAQVQARVQQLLDLVELGGLAHRKVHELSGGEQQRVALARSLAPAPKLLMLDEPLGSLDRALRESLQSQVRRILKEVGVTSVYVTHDRDEAFTMADRLIFMNHGRIIQTGTPEETVANPADGFVARTLGFKNVLPGVVIDDGEAFKVECPVGLITVPKPLGSVTEEGSEITLLVDESGISMSGALAGETQDGNSLEGVVIARVFRGDRYEVRVQVEKGELYCHTAADAASGPAQPGQSVTLTFNPRSVRVLQSGN